VNSVNKIAELALADGSVFFVENEIRFLPNSRLVVFGTWQGKACVAKIFFHPKYAKRHFEREAAGIKMLEAYRNVGSLSHP
jgi:hypothetical protein